MFKLLQKTLQQAPAHAQVLLSLHAPPRSNKSIHVHAQNVTIGQRHNGRLFVRFADLRKPRRAPHAHLCARALLRQPVYDSGGSFDGTQAQAGGLCGERLQGKNLLLGGSVDGFGMAGFEGVDV